MHYFGESIILMYLPSTNIVHVQKAYVRQIGRKARTQTGLASPVWSMDESMALSAGWPDTQNFRSHLLNQSLYVGKILGGLICKLSLRSTALKLRNPSSSQEKHSSETSKH